MGNIKVGIVGGAGYAGGELIRLLLIHPQADIVFVHSKSQVGLPVYQVHTDLIGDTDLVFCDVISEDIDVLFLCLGHGDAKVFLEKNKINKGIKIIDLSQDFRLKNCAQDFIYGLPELNKEQIKSANFVANPGCFATAIQLALLPLASEGILKQNIIVNAITGSTGAGQGLSNTSHFSWRANNVSVYKVFDHQHLGEIEQSLKQVNPGNLGQISFIPMRGDFTRGIFASIVLKSTLSIEALQALFLEYYKDHPFTHFSLEPIDLKQVVNTNKCLLSITKFGDEILITSVIDNLLKGASGQAVQNMNLMFGVAEDTGLRLKASAF